MAKFVDAYVKDTGAHQVVPQRWLDHPVLGVNLRRTPPPGAADPSGEPSMDWTVAQLEKYAADNEIDLDGASKKAEIVAAIHNPTNAPAAGDETQE